MICQTPSFAQDSVEEKILEEQAESSEQSELVELILWLRENPVNLNTAELQTLEAIPGLTVKQSLEILKYRHKQGSFTAVDELLNVPEMDQETFENVRELVSVAASIPKTKASHMNFRSRVSSRLERPIGFENGAYESSAQKVYNRLRFELLGTIKGGLLLEKDSGESRFDDLRLFYLSAAPRKNIQIWLGHFQLEVGQGLVLWGPYGLAKSSAAIFPTRKKARGVRGYSSVDENSAFFGGAASLKAGRFEIIVFASQNKLDATPVSDNAVSTFSTTGFHRNQTEKNKKGFVTESAVGGRIKYNSPAGLSIGATFYQSSFDKTVQNPDFARNRFSFRGKNNTVAGFDWKWRLTNVEIFGEAAQSKNGGRALLAGSIFDFSPIKLAILYRNYQKDFQNFHAFGFGESNGKTQNEKGYYLGLNYQLASHTRISAYFDIFSNPWRTFFEPLPVEGREFSGQIEQKFGRQIHLTFRFREKEDQEAEDVFDAFGRSKKELVQKKRSQLRLQLDYKISKQLRLRSRVEFIKVRQNRFNPGKSKEPENGFLVYQDIRLRPNKKFQIQARLTFFESDSFDSRLFQYENDLPGVLTNRALFGRGNRWYILVKYQPLKKFAAYFKYSETYRDDVDVIGSGADQINGNLDRRVSMQLEMKL
ncbi:helix-hairpin-helix domain-containing protein [candidate division KSB1 bacterium]|nr:helix-hairpin-helix domain-containing protein [candidate division KSB1 bacterium]